MLLGIDVGGTFTDAVLLDRKHIVAQAKVPTVHEDVLQGILQALDAVLPDKSGAVERVVLSSTIVTNALTEHKVPQAFLAVIAGPGMNVAGKFPAEATELPGNVDHRGKVTARVDFAKLSKVHGRGPCVASGKFSVRNSALEQETAEELLHLGFDKVFCGSKMNGELNFIRRTNSAYFAAVTYDLFRGFARAATEALTQRQINAPVHILKADGGTLPLTEALEVPVETVFTGPGASVLGIEALVSPQKAVISLDVGGTTTDIAFWDQGLPLMAKRGAVIDGYPTAVRSFHMRSAGIGGDSLVVRNDDGAYLVGPVRKGRAMAVGGQDPTLGDALITAGLVNFGDKAAAIRGIARFGEPVMEANKIVAAAVGKIQQVIDGMLSDWELQPVYTVEDVIRGTEFVPQGLIGVGGGAKGLVQALGRTMNLPVEIPTGAMVANAIGAALARPTLSAGIRADTTDGYYIIPEEGIRHKLPGGFGKSQAETILTEYLLNKSKDWHLEDQKTEVTSCEFFNTIHGYNDNGEIINMRMQLKPGIMYRPENLQEVKI